MLVRLCVCVYGYIGISDVLIGLCACFCECVFGVFACQSVSLSVLLSLCV